MKNKFWFLVKNSLSKKMRSKWFYATHLILAILIIGLVNIDNIINFFGGDFSSETTIYVIDNTDKSFDTFKTAMDNSFSLTESQKFNIVLSDKSEEEISTMIKDIEEEMGNLLIVIDSSDEFVINTKMISNDYTNTLELSMITSSLTQVKTLLTIEKHGLTEQEIIDLTTPVNLERIYLQDDLNSEEENMEMIMSTLFPIVILPFFMLSIILIQMIGAEVNDEKTTRGMEIIISNVSPGIHLLAKVVSGNIFVISQAILIFIYGLLGLFSRGLFAGDMGVVGDLYNQVTPMLNSVLSPELVSNLIYVIPLVLLIMFLTLVAYSLVAAILASVTTNAEDFQQLQTPIVIISLIGYYLAMMAGLFEGAIVIKVLGYVPFISAILSPSLFIMGDFAVIDMIIVVVVLVGLLFILIKYGLRIYKVGILNYSSKNLWKTMFKALKS